MLGNFKDLTGQKFGRLLVLYRAENKNKRVFWHCLCDCGEEKDVAGRHLSDGLINSCGCLNREEISKRNKKDYTGQKFGYLIVLERLPNYKDRRTYYRCLCDCGNFTIVSSNNLSTGHTQSCGCKSSRNGTKQYNYLHQYRFDDGKKIYCVYKHTSPNGKCYIGITKQTLERRSQNGEGYSTQRVFYNAIKKYGWNNFKHEILEDNLTHNEACEREIYYISMFKSNQSKYGYNTTSGGDGCRDRGIKIAQIFDKEIVNVFSSKRDAANVLKMSHGAIGNYVDDCKKHGGYYFKTISKEEYFNMKNIYNEEHIVSFREKVLKKK